MVKKTSRVKIILPIIIVFTLLMAMFWFFPGALQTVFPDFADCKLGGRSEMKFGIATQASSCVTALWSEAEPVKYFTDGDIIKATCVDKASRTGGERITGFTFNLRRVPSGVYELKSTDSSVSIMCQTHVKEFYDNAWHFLKSTVTWSFDNLVYYKSSPEIVCASGEIVLKNAGVGEGSGLTDDYIIREKACSGTASVDIDKTSFNLAIGSFDTTTYTTSGSGECVLEARSLSTDEVSVCAVEVKLFDIPSDSAEDSGGVVDVVGDVVFETFSDVSDVEVAGVSVGMPLIILLFLSIGGLFIWMARRRLKKKGKKKGGKKNKRGKRR